MILTKKFLQALVGKKIACSSNVIESLWEEKGKKYPAHQIAIKKLLMTRNHPPLPSRVKWSAPYHTLVRQLCFRETAKIAVSLSIVLLEH